MFDDLSYEHCLDGKLVGNPPGIAPLNVEIGRQALPRRRRMALAAASPLKPANRLFSPDRLLVTYVVGAGVCF
jgi:hypothetical protein